MIRRLRSIDAHAAGQPLRLIVEGFPAPQGATMLDKREWVRKKNDRLRRALMLEPRGHADMYGAVLTEPVAPGSHAGLLFMHNDGYATMCGHAVIAATTIALERGLLMPGGDGGTVVYDTPAGVVRAVARHHSLSRGAPPPLADASSFDPLRTTLSSAEGSPKMRGMAADAAVNVTADPAHTNIRVERVVFTNVPSFVLHAGLAVKLGARHLRADIAFGGAFYAIVDGEAAGLPIDAAHLPELRRAGMEIAHAIEAAHAVAHPLEPGLQGLDGTIFTGPPNDPRADLRNVTVFANAQVDRSPCGTGTAAVMAVVEAMGLLGADGRFTQEGLLGTRFEGRIAARTTVGDYQAIVPEIEGSAWITGEHTFLIDDTDPLKDGFRL